MLKMIMIIQFALPNPAQLYINELNYWEKEHEEFVKITPHGKHQIEVYNKSEAFYSNRRAYLLNQINNYNYEIYSN